MILLNLKFSELYLLVFSDALGEIIIMNNIVDEIKSLFPSCLVQEVSPPPQVLSVVSPLMQGTPHSPT